MKRLLSIVAMLGMTGFGLSLSAQQTPSTTPQAGSSAQQTQTDATNSQPSARSFEGKISKSGDKLVLKDSTTQTSYQLDDQSKAQQFAGKNVKVMATLDPATNTLHIVDITPSESR